MEKTMSRFLAFFLTLTLIFPNVSFALRDQAIVEEHPKSLSGLEEALRSDNPEDLVQLASAAIPSALAASPAPMVTLGAQRWFGRKGRP